jgi:hypothetical protein
MRNYWTCTKFADWIRGTTKIKCGTGKEWHEWEKAAKEKYPIRWWIAEEGLDHLQDIWCWIPERINDVRYYINNRWVTQTHALKSHPRDIPRGEWRDVGNRFLPCLMNELVDFVEIEQAWHHCLWNDDAKTKFQVPWYRRGWLRWRTWRCPAAGLEYLDWASNLVIDEQWGVQPGDARYGTPTDQAASAREIRELYFWWKEVRPNRADPYDESGWNEICRRRDINKDDIFGEDDTPDKKQAAQDSLAQLNNLEAEYDKEDEEMLIRLVRVRHALWT